MWPVPKEHEVLGCMQKEEQRGNRQGLQASSSRQIQEVEAPQASW